MLKSLSFDMPPHILLAFLFPNLQNIYPCISFIQLHGFSNTYAVADLGLVKNCGGELKQNE